MLTAVKVATFPKLMERLTDIAGPLAGPKTRQAIEDFTHITLVVLNQTCFASGTPILTPDGVRPIESLAAGDQVWARSELNPRAPVVARTIERVFELTGPILELHAGGRIIKTTGEHPFYVADQGWCRARYLIPGLPLAGLDERTTELEQIVVTEQTATVYNIRVAEDHTYFVGAEDWGFSLWVHNAYSWVKNADGTYDILDNAGKLVKNFTTQNEADNFLKTINEATNAIGDAAKKEVPHVAPTNKVDLTDAKANKHILEGDATGGGHRPGTGKPGKSEFPAGWSDEKILDSISDVATDPSVKWSKPDKRGYITGSKIIDGIDIKVVFDTKKNRIVSGYPTNVPRNP